MSLTSSNPCEPDTLSCSNCEGRADDSSPRSLALTVTMNHMIFLNNLLNFSVSQQPSEFPNPHSPRAATARGARTTRSTSPRASAPPPPAVEMLVSWSHFPSHLTRTDWDRDWGGARWSPVNEMLRRPAVCGIGTRRSHRLGIGAIGLEGESTGGVSSSSVKSTRDGSCFAVVATTGPKMLAPVVPALGRSRGHRPPMRRCDARK